MFPRSSSEPFVLVTYGRWLAKWKLRKAVCCVIIMKIHVLMAMTTAKLKTRSIFLLTFLLSVEKKKALTVSTRVFNCRVRLLFSSLRFLLVYDKTIAITIACETKCNGTVSPVFIYVFSGCTRSRLNTNAPFNGYVDWNTSYLAAWNDFSDKKYLHDEMYFSY